MNIEIRPFDLIHASSSDWSRLAECNDRLNRDLDPELPAVSIETWRSLRQVELQQQDMIAYEAIDMDEKERMAGFVRLMFWRESSPSYRGNEHICELVGINVRPEYRRNGIATKLLPAVYDKVKARGCRLIVGPLMNDAARIFLRKIGGTEALAMRDNRLNLDNVDWDMVNSWVREGPKRSPSTRIKFFHTIPDKMLERFCNVYTEVYNQAPRDQLERGDEVTTPESWRARAEKLASDRWKYLAAVTIEDNGDISGLTDVLWVPSMPSMLWQALTGVQEHYRGRGLGKWLKGAALLRARSEFPTVTTVVTQNATSNEPMLDINRRLGFKLYREIYQFQVELQKLKKYAKR